jgi:protein required for attachment to host cells
MNTWIVCGSQSGAKIYRCSDLKKGLHFVANLPHPEGRLREQDLVSDQSGNKAGFDGATLVGGRHNTDPRDDAKDKLVDEFAVHLSKEIDRGVDQQAFDSLIVCADPKFLGKVRSKLSKRAEKMIIGSLNLNFYNSEMGELFNDVLPIIKSTLSVRGKAA